MCWSWTSLSSLYNIFFSFIVDFLGHQVKIKQMAVVQRNLFDSIAAEGVHVNLIPWMIFPLLLIFFFSSPYGHQS